MEKNTSTEADRLAHEAAMNRQRLTNYYTRQKNAARARGIVYRVPSNHLYLFYRGCAK